MKTTHLLTFFTLIVAACSASGFDAYSWGDPTTIKKVEIWKIKSTNQGCLEARQNRIWEPDTK